MQVLAGVVLIRPDSVLESGKRAELPSCVVVPESTEGPFFADVQLDRSDIRIEPSTNAAVEGMPLNLLFNVSRITGNECAPLKDAIVNVWQCDAGGRYSAFSGGGSTEDQKFLRGYQRTDVAGKAKFETIFPGWYRGRAVHIHFKIRTEEMEGNAYEFTSQLFFEEGVIDQIHSLEPYAGHGERTTRNERDGIYRNGGDKLTLDVARAADNGFASTFSIGLDLTDTTIGQPDGFRRGRRRGRG